MAKPTKTGIRYTEDQKEKILKYVEAQGKGGMTRATEKFGASYLTIRSWMNPGKAKATKPAKATKVQKVAKKAPKVPKGEEVGEALSATFKGLQDQVARLAERLSKLEVKAPKAKAKPVEAPVEAPKVEAAAPGTAPAPAAPETPAPETPVLEATLPKETPVPEVAPKEAPVVRELAVV